MRRLGAPREGEPLTQLNQETNAMADDSWVRTLLELRDKLPIPNPDEQPNRLDHCMAGLAKPDTTEEDDIRDIAKTRAEGFSLKEVQEAIQDEIETDRQRITRLETLLTKIT